MQMLLPSMNKAPLDKATLFSHLLGAANILRGSVDASDFKNYILGLLFYKRLCDVYDEELEDTKAKLANVPNADELAHMPTYML